MISTAIRVVVGSVFLFAGVTKMWDPVQFAFSLGQYGVVPLSLVFPTVVAVPLLEITLGMGMLIFPYEAAIPACVVLSIFTFVLLIAAYGGYSGDCGCMGFSMTWPIAVAKNVGMIGALAYLRKKGAN